MSASVLQLPVDADSARTLAAGGLRMAIVDPADDAQLRPWRDAVHRGFLDPETTDEEHAEAIADHAHRRATGVYDEGIAEPARPVATIEAWSAPLTVPGGDVPAWAISAVTVAPTHRRRGIARAMLEAELRTAVAGGFPVAALTVSEATIYARYGFGPATRAAELRIDTRRVRWLDAPAAGRVQLVSRATILRDAHDLYERSRRRVPGGVGLSGLLLERLFGRPSDGAAARARRFGRYDDADGVPQGYVSYTATEGEDDFTASHVEIHHLAAATDEAEAALWRFVTEMDLIGEVRARLRSVDETLPWWIDDQRAIRTTAVTDHLWLRVLDPVAALTARTVSGEGRIVLDVADALGHADGRFLLEADGSDARVERLDGAGPAGPPEVALDVAVLGSLLLGGVPAGTLARAGRVAEVRPRGIDALDTLLRSPWTPWLGVWF